MLHSSLLVSSGRCGSFSSSSARTPSAELTVKNAFFSACFFCALSPHAARYHFTCLIYSSGRCGSFFGSTAAMGDEYSRAVLGSKNKDKGKDRENA
ncbi:hypothetical protein ACFX10_034013 [Malus domestica]